MRLHGLWRRTETGRTSPTWPRRPVSRGRPCTGTTRTEVAWSRSSSGGPPKAFTSGSSPPGSTRFRQKRASHGPCGAFVDEGDAFVVLVSERRHSEGSEFDRLVLPPIQRMLEIGRTQGQIRSDLQTVVLAEALMSIAAGVLRNSSLGRDDLVATISTVFLDGALAPPRPEVPRLEHARRARHRDQGERNEP